MSGQNRRPSFSSSTTSSLAKRHASSENVAKRRAPLSDLTNQKNASHSVSRNSLPSSTLVTNLTLFD